MLLAESNISEITRSVDDAFLWIGGICVVLLVLITLVMIAFVIRYSHRWHPEAAKFEGNNRLEIIWTVIPTLIVLVMFFKGYEGFKLMRDIPDDAMVVDVVARSWFWTFNYPEYGISSDRLYVPINRAVRFNLTAPADDVVHSFYVPAFRVKEDCVPGRVSQMWFKPEQEGTYNVFCAEYCGRDHSKMITVMEVLSADGYQKWIKQKVADMNKPVDLEQALDPKSEAIVERDAAKLYSTYCVSCHGSGGEGGLVAGARDFRSLAGWKQGPKLGDIFRTLSQGIPGTQMRAFNNLQPWDRFALAHHVAAFYQGTDRPRDTAAELAQLKQDYRLGEKPVEAKRISIERAMELISEEEGGSPSDG
jgi:cytochrome c oxidase subunit II